MNNMIENSLNRLFLQYTAHFSTINVVLVSCLESYFYNFVCYYELFEMNKFIPSY